MSIDILIHQSAESLRQRLGARQLSMLIYAPENRLGSAEIVHCGEGEPLPELTDLEAAESLLTGTLASNSIDVLASRGDGHLICVPYQAHAPRIESDQRRERLLVTNVWLGVRGLTAHSRDLDWLAPLTSMVAAYYHQRFADSDTLTGLPGRNAFDRELTRLVAEKAVSEQSLTTLLITPLLIQDWNEQEGRAETDRRLGEIAATLTSCVRQEDTLYRYGGATFALNLVDASPNQAERAAANICERFAGRVHGHVFESPLAVGGKWSDGTERLDRYVYLESADRALRHAQLDERNRVIILSGADIEPAQSHDPLLGVFTGDVDQDYRNMRVLWESLRGFSEHSDAQHLLEGTFALLAKRLDPISMGLVERSESGWALIHPSEAVELPWQDWAEAASAADHLVSMEFEGNALVLVHIDTPEPLVFWVLCDRLGASDLLLWSTLLKHMGRTYWERMSLEDELTSQRLENEQLRDTVQRIQHKDGPTSYLFESSAMRSLLGQAEALAPTNETVLITGESGTGKEVIARTVHEMSSLSDAPLVVVDCAAIPPSLFEAELFGRTKGAYTSAEQGAEGYIAKADGGTLFLDEIGELPIDVQAKLLRFLQEKEIRPVGSGVTRKVEVRVIAATNRDLAAEVEAGRFRGDLFHRLNVLNLYIPPLRERHADILVLARHFVASYGQLHGKRRELSEAAENKLLSFPWAGNVRELQHCLLRAVLLGENERISPDDLNLDDEACAEAPPEPVARPTPPLDDDPWANLEGVLSDFVEECVEQGFQLPLGTWLADDLVLVAFDRAQGIAKHASHLLGLAETTYRRQLERVEQERGTGMLVRSKPWQDSMPDVLAPLLNAYAAEEEERSLLQRVRELLLQIVRAAAPTDSKRAAAIMGVTVPTYKRHVQSMESAA